MTGRQQPQRKRANDAIHPRNRLNFLHCGEMALALELHERRGDAASKCSSWKRSWARLSRTRKFGGECSHHHRSIPTEALSEFPGKGLPKLETAPVSGSPFLPRTLALRQHAPAACVFSFLLCCKWVLKKYSGEGRSMMLRKPHLHDAPPPDSALL
ncbi:hypothetical protein BDV06DRAFT_195237 [Aspergillus oleicola]